MAGVEGGGTCTRPMDSLLWLTRSIYLSVYVYMSIYVYISLYLYIYIFMYMYVYTGLIPGGGGGPHCIRPMDSLSI